MVTRAELVQSASTDPKKAWKMYATPFQYMMGITLVVLTCGELILARAVRLGGLSQLLAAWPGLLLLAGVLCYCIVRSFSRLIETCLLAIWAVLFTNTLTILILIAGRSPFPLIDAALARMDARAHFSTLYFVHLVARAPLTAAGLAVVYSVLPALIVAAILIPALSGHTETARRYVMSIIVAAILTAACSALWPAVGPWTMQAIRPTREQAGIAAYLIRLKSSTPVDIDLLNAGIVSFPSFHVVLAILSALSLSCIRRLRAVVWVLAGLICISTITTGWHYGIDVLAGLMLMAVTVYATNRIPCVYP
jgi:membrane-associated phospholipid phosphatase